MVRSKGKLAAWLALVVALGPACARKAPGPQECRRYALSLFRLRAEEDLGGRTPRELALRDQIDELTRECLVVPYDRQLLRCTEETGRVRACRAAFDRRRASRSEPLR